MGVSIHWTELLECTTGMYYWTGVGVNCVCSKPTNCTKIRIISCMATPHGTYVYRAYAALAFMVLCVSSLSEVTISSYHLFFSVYHRYTMAVT